MVQTGAEQLRRNKAHLCPQPEHSVQAQETPGFQRETTMVQPEPLVEMPETGVHRREAEVEQEPETARAERHTEKERVPPRRPVKPPKWLRDFVVH